MLRPVVTRGLMLDFLPNQICDESEVQAERIFCVNENKVKNGALAYVMSREFRVEDNWGLIFAQELAKKYDRELKILLYSREVAVSNCQKTFFEAQMPALEGNLRRNNFSYELCEDLQSIDWAGAFVFDFNPLVNRYDFSKTVDAAVFEIDSHNIVPARFVSDKKEFSAATLRRKIYSKVSGFLTEFPDVFSVEKSAAGFELENFVQNKLDGYAINKNNPNLDFVSGLSKFLHFGFVSAQRVALDVFKSDVSRENKETFLEELIVRKELADNFCLYESKYKTFDAAWDWAKHELDIHRDDLRTYVYTKEEFESADTHDELWNASQKQLLAENKMHGFLRMYWAKKILEWSKTPEEALKIAIYLNDTYAFDGNDPNGYVGILWSIAGVHDRAFSSRLIFGKIRYMSLDGCKKKFDVDEFVKKYV